MKYFGILKGSGFETLDLQQQLELLLEAGVYTRKHIVRLTKEPQLLWPPTSPPQAKLSEAFAKEFYSFLQETYQPEIENRLLKTMQRFNEQVFGLGKKQRRNVALKRFKKLYKDARNNSVEIVFSKETKGLQKVKNLGKIESLSWQQQAFQNTLAESSLKVGFLLGDLHFYADGTPANESLVSDLILLESTLKCLLVLNREFGFEADTVFSSSVPKKPIRKKKKNTSGKKEAPATLDPLPEIKLPAINSSKVFTQEAAFEYLLEKVF